MSTMRPTAALGTLMLALSASPLPAVAQSIDTLALRAHTRFLASDLLEGRGTGTRGERLAAAYIAAQLTEQGVCPLTADGYLLPLPLAAARILPETELTVAWPGPGPRGVPAGEVGYLTFRSGQDFVVNTGGAGAFHDFGGPLLWLGSPDDAVQASLRAPDLRGKVVVVSGPLGAAAGELVPHWIEAGVAGVVSLIPDDNTFQLYVRSRGPERFYVAAPVNDPIWQPDLPVLLAGSTVSGVITAALGIGQTLAAGRPAAVPTERPDARLDARIRTAVREVPSANVAGFIPGSDPALRREAVLFTAHYDHLGISTPVDGDSIYNGFSDNAAGVAMVLAIAEALAADPPARSTVFVFLSGEERGLLGATFLAERGLPGGLTPVAVVNLDAGAPPAAPLEWRIAGADASTLGDLAVRVTEEAGWDAVPGAASPNSDYWPFLARGVPAVFLIPGTRWEGTSEAQKQALQARWDRYHQAGDHWHPDFPFGGLQRYAELGLRVGRAAADAGQAPSMREGVPPGR
ncbi:MAG: M28 family peptidase [Gemmatimonadota bacterium]